MRELIRQAVLEGLGNRSFMVDTDADLMGLIGAAALANGFSQPERRAMSEFGQGFGLPWLVLRGLPLQEQLPKTPQGYGDDTQTLFSDTMLLGGMFLAGLKPIAYSYENFSRVMRNVAPSKLEVDSVSWKPFPSIFVLRGTEAQRWPRPSGTDRVAPCRCDPSGYAEAIAKPAFASDL
jgi:hypothetical protein